MIIGIDLGTTNSLVACWKDGTPQIIPNSLGKNLTPSCVSMTPLGEILTGEAARERLHTHADQSVANFKRYMGTNRLTKLGGESFRPEELSSFILRALKADAEAYLGEPVTEAIISVPAYFSDAQRKATQAAGKLAGLKVERLINEPTAAALAYGIRTPTGEDQFLVFDLGGGTFDVSILELFDGIMEVRSSAGDNFLGGEDFVDAVTQHFYLTQASSFGINPSNLSREQSHAIRHAAQKLIHQLSDNDHGTVSFLLEGKQIDLKLNEEDFAKISVPLLERIRTPVERALRDARIRVSNLSDVFLAGGATRMPIVRKLVARMFGRFPSCHIHPDEVVALGTAVQAGLKMGDSALDEMVMTDVCPYTLGIKIAKRVGSNPGGYADGFYLPVLERNSVIPFSRSEDIFTIADYQKVLSVEVFQGESRLVKDNIMLGKLEVQVPSKPAGTAGANIRFTYDASGILEVEATVHETEEKHRLVIQENPGVLSAKEIEQRLKELNKIKLHPRDEMRNTTLLARADRMYAEILGPAREVLSTVTAQFQAALERQNPDEIALAREQLKELLESIGQTPLFPK